MEDIYSIFMLFKEKQLELEYIQAPDPLFKYSLASSFILILGIYFMQKVSLNEHKTMPFFIAAVSVNAILLPVAWTHFIWNRFVTNFIEKQIENRLVRCIVKISKKILESFCIRLFVYTLIVALASLCVIHKLLFNCIPSITEALDDFRNGTGREINSNLEKDEFQECLVSWQFTETYALLIVVTFVFLRMFIWIKFMYFLILWSFYVYSTIKLSHLQYMEDETINYRVDPILAHVFVTGVLTLALHLMDRQTDYMNRLDFLMNRKVRTEQEEANVLKHINEKLLNNILPEHVANIYLDVNREMHDLYYEEHYDVAVMFASLILDKELLNLPDKKFLAMMNEYISCFDTLTKGKEFTSIEKIKLAKWTYMAACGLKDKKGKELIEKHVTSSSLLTLLNFAEAMFKTLENVNKMRCQSTQLRVGICTGPVIAGVVGSRKPLYDIWGDAVNMASRMDSTGLVGHIQVMEKTAELIRRCGIECMYREEIIVKGVNGKVRTYFVKMDHTHSLVRSGIME
ncbi:unnamed protein product [Acanthoscelides obtectus]|nr:unnamed protein product [Acanthoscelides obtectus]CAK1648923.1 Adenylate cyclase type 4 [Acanthoscelides obtectus]